MVLYLVICPVICRCDHTRTNTGHNITSKRVFPHTHMVEWFEYAHPSRGGKLSWCRTHVHWLNQKERSHILDANFRSLQSREGNRVIATKIISKKWPDDKQTGIFSDYEIHEALLEDTANCSYEITEQVAL